METKFKLLSYTEDLIDYMNLWLPNFPKKQIILTQNIKQTGYDLLECVFGYNIQQSQRIKDKYLKDYLIKLSMYDFFIRESFHKKYISKKQTNSLTKIMVNCRKIAYGLIRSEKDVQQTR